MWRLLALLKAHRGTVGLILLLNFIQSLSTLYLPNLMSDIVDTGIMREDVPYILRIGLWMLVVAVGGVACAIAAGWLSSQVSSEFGRVLRTQVFTRVERFSLQEFNRIGTASLITRTTNDITQVQMLVNMALRLMVLAPLMAIGGIVMAILTDARLSLVIVVVVPVMGVALWVVLGRGMGLFRAIQGKMDVLNRVLRESLTGVRVIRAFNRTEYERRRFDAANRDLTDTTIRVNQLMAALMPLIMLIINFSTLAIMWFGSLRIDHLDLQVGSLMAFLQYVMQILFAVMMVSMIFFLIPRASASAGRIREVLDTVPQIRDPDPTATALPHGQGECAVEFEHVTFRYPGAEKPALVDISFCVRPGQVTAVIGGTGSGKSTLLNLILRFYDVEEGSVRVDGEDVRRIPQRTLRSRIGYVSQKPVLFSGTVEENIRFGREDAQEEDVRRAAEVAQAAEFIEEMPGGFRGTIAQGGANLSGGQKQRLAIARALVRRPHIYLFDDSFSALDFRTDVRLRAALREKTRDAAVILVAQRISTVMDADQIVVLDEGRLVGRGTHRELMRSCPVYREIAASQLSEEELA